MDVTVGDKRFDRYYREIRLALRPMSHGARAQLASDWSGLTLDRLVTLRQRWMPDTEAGYRGQSPTSFLPFFRSTLKASHAAMFVGIFRMVGLNTCKPSLEGGERLCEAYEIYLEWEPEEHLEFDYAVLLAMGAITREEIDLSTCESCEAALLLDRLKKAPLLKCARCRSSNLTRDELERLFKALRASPSFGTNLLTIKLLLALGVRKGELLRAKWTEFDLDGVTDSGPVWRLPAKRIKTAAPLSIPLAPAVVGWLRALRESPVAANSYFQSGAETAGNVHYTSASIP